MNDLIVPDWPAPATVRACSTTRAGGVSVAPWDSLNLGDHVGDQPAAVQANRQRLVDMADLPAMPWWLEQIHGTEVVRLDGRPPATRRADAVWSNQAGTVCAVMTADCLPVLFCSFDGKEVAAAHAGWRGLCTGVLENTLRQFSAPPEEIHVWMGPAIGPEAFEVGPEVRAAFMAHDPAAAGAFRAAGDKFYADLWQLARQRLAAQGVASVSGGGRCAWHDSAHFFSWRRSGTTGRMASLIWLI
ncbi:purine nucleoside phosphorylase YfiH [Pantoea alhagi]|uniref:purine nucleoside phosphorylase YfiH n=1 Tax=Pantoea alhagi TaxID=1891675 RepID=UPI00202AF502|nr:purine nucleoside phosphorylase YfiH [Pantoea alhagi]URQ60108.1 purine nucleoside phosphorylase YfiH [Pantoea alhagi]